MKAGSRNEARLNRFIQFNLSPSADVLPIESLSFMTSPSDPSPSHSAHMATPNFHQAPPLTCPEGCNSAHPSDFINALLSCVCLTPYPLVMSLSVCKLSFWVYDCAAVCMYGCTAVCMCVYMNISVSPYVDAEAYILYFSHSLKHCTKSIHCTNTILAVAIHSLPRLFY